MKNVHLKIFFAFAIFAFALALSYFTADYLSANRYLDYWSTLILFSGLYILLGVLVSGIFPVSSGFLFSADILIIHILNEYYGEWSDYLKLLIVTAILICLYLVSWVYFKEGNNSVEVLS